MSTFTQNLDKAEAELKAAEGVQEPKREPKPSSKPSQGKKNPIKEAPQAKEPVWRPKLENKGGNLRLVYKTQVQGLSAESSHEILDSKATEYLYPLIKPLCKLVNAVVNRGTKAISSPGPEHVRDAKGRPTKEVEKGPDGKTIMLPSALDIAKSAYAEMMKDPEVTKLLEALQKRFDILDAMSEKKKQDMGSGSIGSDDSGEENDQTQSEEEKDDGNGGGSTSPLGKPS